MQNATLEGFRLSPQQRNLWALQQTSAAQPYRIVFTLSIQGNLQPAILERAFREVISRHAILRTTFHQPSGFKTPFQVISERVQLSWQLLDLSNLDHERSRVEIENCFAVEANKDFDFERGPLLRATLIKLSSADHVLLLSLPAICADSITFSTLISELVRAYEPDLTEQKVVSDPMQYADFAEFENELLHSDEVDAAEGKAYWRTQAGVSRTATIFPFERDVEESSALALESLPIAIDDRLAAKITAFAEDQQASVSSVLFACWQSLVWRLTGQPNFAIFNFFDGRKFEGLRDAFGLYARYLPVRCHWKDVPFAEILKDAHEGLNWAAEWQEYFDYAEHSLAGRKAIAFEFNDWPVCVFSGGLSCSVLKRYVCIQPFKLLIRCVRSGASLTVEMEYNAHAFDRESVERLGGYFRRLLSGVAQNPSAEIGAIDILADSERHHLLVEFNRTEVEYPKGKCIHQLFEDQVAKTPDAIALVFEDQRFTYRELNERANQLAYALRRRGVGPGVCVGLCVERSVEMIVGLLGILKSGGTYVPLNPDHPQERLAIQLAESNASVLLTNSALDQSFAFAGETIDFHRDRALLEAELKNNPQAITTPEHLVYVIYTSGSTGIPKGVAVRHRNLVNYTQFILRSLQIDGPLHFATVSTIAADLGNTCLFPSLVSGGCLHVLSSDVAIEGELFRDYLAKHPIDVLKIVPSHLHGLLTSHDGGRILPSKYLILGGEALSWDLLQRLSQIDHTCQIINHYGPTETTVGSLTFSIDEQNLSDYSSTVPIGRAIANTRVYILDRWMGPVPLGAAGELYIGGAGVAAGYLNNAVETAARFVPDPFSDDLNSRLYRTGDLARYLPDGNVEFLGRADHQVKVRGYRVELGEIEAMLSTHAGVRQALVTVCRDQSGDERVVAYVVSSPISQDELRDFLKQKLPDYMVPSAFVFLKSLPLTPNGKVDRAALPAPEDTRPDLQKVFVAPRTPVEKQLAGIWASLLKVSAVGVHDNFFDLGGHSLLATQVVSRMRKAFQLEIPLRTLFESPTVAQLAETIEGASSNDAARLLSEIEELSEEDARQLLEQTSTAD
jgi:amino acid adenylation domain-containing protein